MTRRIDITDRSMFDLWLELDTGWTLSEFSVEYWKLKDAEGRYLIDADPFGHREPTLVGKRLVFAQEPA